MRSCDLSLHHGHLSCDVLIRVRVHFKMDTQHENQREKLSQLKILIDKYDEKKKFDEELDSLILSGFLKMNMICEVNKKISTIGASHLDGVERDRLEKLQNFRKELFTQLTSWREEVDVKKTKCFPGMCCKRSPKSKVSCFPAIFKTIAGRSAERLKVSFISIAIYVIS